MTGSMRTFVTDWRTDWRTDGQSWIQDPRVGPKTPNLDTKASKTGWPDFFGAWYLKKICRECSNPSKYEKLAKTYEAFSRKWPKTPNLDTRGSKQGNPIFFRTWSLNNEKLAKTNKPFSRKWWKTAKKLSFGYTFFFQKSGFVTFIHLQQANFL